MWWFVIKWTDTGTKGWILDGKIWPWCGAKTTWVRCFEGLWCYSFVISYLASSSVYWINDKVTWHHNQICFSLCHFDIALLHIKTSIYFKEISNFTISETVWFSYLLSSVRARTDRYFKFKQILGMAFICLANEFWCRSSVANEHAWIFLDNTFCQFEGKDVIPFSQVPG